MDSEQLTASTLQKYVVSNSDYYERYLKEFNETGKVLSWNFAVFFFSIPWLIYRKVWLPIIIVAPLTFAFVIVLLGKVSHTYIPIPYSSGYISPNSSAWLSILVSLLVVKSVCALFANYLVLLRAKKREGKNVKGVTNIWITIVLGFILFIPTGFILYTISLEAINYRSIHANKQLSNYYSHYKKDTPFVGLRGYEKQGLYQAARNISPSFFKSNKLAISKSYKVEKWFVCFDSVEFIEILEAKGLKLTTTHLAAAKQCNAKIAEKYIAEKISIK